MMVMSTEESSVHRLNQNRHVQNPLDLGRTLKTSLLPKHNACCFGTVLLRLTVLIQPQPKRLTQNRESEAEPSLAAMLNQNRLLHQD